MCGVRYVNNLMQNLRRNILRENSTELLDQNVEFIIRLALPSHGWTKTRHLRAVTVSPFT